MFDFPSNDFEGDEPFSDKQIKEWIRKHYNSKFPIMHKIHVNGEQTSEVWAWLR